MKSHEPLPLVGLIEIAMRAGVKRPVVSTWRTRYDDFPAPVAVLAVGPIFWWHDVERWLIDTGRNPQADWPRQATRVLWESQERHHLPKPKGE